MWTGSALKVCRNQRVNSKRVGGVCQDNRAVVDVPPLVNAIGPPLRAVKAATACTRRQGDVSTDPAVLQPVEVVRSWFLTL